MARTNPMKLMDLVGNKAYIYGTGNFALRIKNVLIEENIDVNAFLELNKKISTYALLPVYKLDEFQNLDRLIPVIIGLGNPQADIKFVTNQLELFGFQIINPIQFAVCAFNSGHTFENYWLTGDLSVYKQNREAIELAKSMLSDTLSMNIFDDILNYRKNGKIGQLPEKLDSRIQYLAPDLPWGGFLERGVKVLDCGAFDGDTFENFRDLGVKIDYWNFVEPDEANFKKIQEKYLHSLRNVAYTHAGVTNVNGQFGFETNTNGNGSKFSQTAEKMVRSICIDQLVDSPFINFLKFDIEGEELNALKGAENTIKINRPIMAISIYHKPSHHWEILNYLSTFHTQYSYFLRVHGEQTFDTILYCMPLNL